jgi:hypothetical protein
MSNDRWNRTVVTSENISKFHCLSKTYKNRSVREEDQRLHENTKNNFLTDLICFIVISTFVKFKSTNKLIL